MDSKYIGMKLDDAIILAKNNGYNYKVIIVSSDKVKKADTKIVIKTKENGKNIVFYVGEFLFNVEE